MTAPAHQQEVHLGLSIDNSALEATRIALDALATSAERASAALAALGGQPHGGMTIQAVGSLVNVDIKPVSTAQISAAAFYDEHLSRRSASCVLRAAGRSAPETCPRCGDGLCNVGAPSDYKPLA